MGVGLTRPRVGVQIFKIMAFLWFGKFLCYRLHCGRSEGIIWFFGNVRNHFVMDNQKLKLSTVATLAW